MGRWLCRHDRHKWRFERIDGFAFIWFACARPACNATATNR